MTWTLHDLRTADVSGRPRYGYLSIELDGMRIADVFPYAAAYAGKVEPEWLISQAQRIVDTMNAAEASA